MTARFDLNTLRTFIRIAEHGSISRAAELEHTVPSAISKRVSDLEQATGTVLLNRHRRGVSLTPPGSEVVAHARRVVGELERLEQILGEYAIGVRGQVQLTANTTGVVEFLPEDLAAFFAKHPDVTIDLEEATSEAVQEKLLDGRAEVGIFAIETPHPALHTQPYRDSRLVVVVPGNHRLADQPRLRFEQTLGYDHVGLHRGTRLTQVFYEAARRLGRPLPLRIQANSLDGISKMVGLGLGIAILPGGGVLPYLDRYNLASIPLDEDWAVRRMFLATRAGRQLTRAASLLLEHLIARSRGPD